MLLKRDINKIKHSCVIPLAQYIYCMVFYIELHIILGVQVPVLKNPTDLNTIILVKIIIFLQMEETFTHSPLELKMSFY